MYLTDELWGHIQVVGDNSFSLNCPSQLSNLDKSFGDKLFDIFTTPADVGGWD